MTKNVSVLEGYKKTEVGVIPEEWEVKPLGKYAKLQGGFAFKSKDAAEYGVRWLKIANVGIGSIKWDVESHLPSSFIENYPEYILKKGQIVMAMTRPVLGDKLKITKLKESDVPSLLNQRVGRFCITGNLDNDYLYQVAKFIYFLGEIKLKIRGTDPPNISSTHIESIKIAVPSLPEQQKIASILSKVDEQIEQTEQIIEKTELLKKGLMQKLLTKGIGHTKFKKTEIGEIPDEWEIKGLTKVFNLIDYRGRTPPFSENGIPYIGADNVKDAGIVFNKRRYVSEETYAKYMTRGIPNPDDILFTTEAPLGNVAQVPEYKFCFAQRVVVFQCKNDFSPLYFMYLLKNKIMQKQFLDWATGTTVTGISSKNMKFIKLYYPKNIQEQKQIGQVLESVDKYIDSEKENLLSLQELKKGLMQDLLTGKVRVCV